ncbi:MAG TPA: Asp-tRNA(Asn)/Glu-tRNA(Gln) amidotransferase subunit GatC [Candidatus Acidoferrales bacterium]|nr:Asp-tRNA(Asn)/Glu-tRNA(Gln) amidotransferase subunit GatC [Candidatus Acidoferrales bacterium]
MKISREDVLYVAELAHLELAEAEVEKFREQLDGILTYIDKLKEVDVSGVEPMAQVLEAHAAPNATLREDVVHTSDVAKAILEQAPEAKAPYFRVPKVIEK